MRGELASNRAHAVLPSARRCRVVVHACSRTSCRGIASIGNNSGSSRVEVHQAILFPFRA